MKSTCPAKPWRSGGIEGKRIGGKKMVAEIITKVLYFSIGSGILAWLIKAIFKQYFSKDLEKFKASLEKEAFSYRVRYEKMHAERAEVIKNLYKKIVRTHRAFHSFMNIFQQAGDKLEPEKGQLAADEANDFTDYFEENKIFLGRELADKIEDLSKTFRLAWIQFESSRRNEKYSDSYFNNWIEAFKLIDEETPKIKTEIENEFRIIIGIDNEKK